MKKTTLFSCLFLLLLAAAGCHSSGEKSAERNAWITVDKQGAIQLLGKTVPNLEALQSALYDTLSKMEVLPTDVSVHFDPEILMGTRGAVNDQIAEALASAAARKACETTIHDFYRWYDAFARDDSRYIQFTDQSGKHVRLDTAKLELHLAQYKSSGFVSERFIANRKAYYQNCEKLWQNEPKDEPGSCMDHDPCFCAQDWELDFWTKSPVSIQRTGEQAVATLSGTEGGSPREQRINMVLENGKWLIADIRCE
ncbi:MAG: DUF3828 domain-containing protein [Saprospiraceae bacterium]|nr:DUF3828 domain-containing protein [Saprospiraceae bacterium]